MPRRLSFAFAFESDPCPAPADPDNAAREQPAVIEQQKLEPRRQAVGMVDRD